MTLERNTRRILRDSQSSSTEREVIKHEEEHSFEEKIDMLREGAKIVAKIQRYLPDIQALMKQKGGAENITEEDCVRFTERNQNFSFEPAMVKATALELEAEEERTTK
jgi:hypothetical protein